LIALRPLFFQSALLKGFFVMSNTNEPDSSDSSTPYNDVNMSCGHCSYLLKPTYQQAFDLIKQQPISCDQCNLDLLLDEADRELLNVKLESATRLGKLLLLFLGPYFLFGLICSIYFMANEPPFPGFSGVLALGGVVVFLIIKAICTKNIDRAFVLFEHGRRITTSN
jgi:hypothetical protein